MPLIPHLLPAVQFTSPGPNLIEWGPIVIRWYGFLIATAVLLGISLSQYLARRRGLDPDKIVDLAIWLVLGAIPGARLYYVLFEWQDYAQRPADILAIWKGGIAIHGAVIGGLIAALIFSRINRLSFWQIADVVAPSLILGQAIGRWGNFFNSEAFGRPTDLPWKLYIPSTRDGMSLRPPGYENVEYFHPTFLYESLWDLTLFAILIALFFWSLKSKSALKVGTLFMVYLLGYGCGRVWIEGLRTDSLMLGSLRVAQVVSLVQVALGGLGLIWLYRLHRRLPDVVTPEGNQTTKEKPPEG